MIEKEKLMQHSTTKLWKLDKAKLVQHFNVWMAFRNRVYKKTLTAEDISGTGSEKFIDTVFKVDDDGTVEPDLPIQEKSIVLIKSDKKYLLPTKYQHSLPLNVKQGFDCYLKPSDKTIYHLITEPASTKITPIKTKSFKELVKMFNPVKHSNDRTWAFLKIQAIGSKAKGGKYCLCSEPATGKNANDTIFRCITNDVIRIAKPTLAKLETAFFYNQKVIPDELTSLTATQIHEIEPFFLNIADESPTFAKHSMARRKDMNEVDLVSTSNVFTYNRVQDVKGGKFFDDLWTNPHAFKSRYPAILLEGYVQEALPKLSMKQSEEIMEENFELLKEIAKNLVYYFENMHKELHGWNRSKADLKGRHLTNLECVLDALDVYCESQIEYDEWLVWLNERISAYKAMVQNSEGEPIVKEEEMIK